MSLESVSGLGFGGSEHHRLNGVLAELQGQKFALVTGADVGDAIAVTDMEYEDTLKAVLNLTDLTQLDPADFHITDRRASGTLTLDVGLEDGDQIEVNGKVYTFTEMEETIAINVGPNIIPIEVGPSGVDVEVVAARLAKVLMSSDKEIEAVAAAEVVTVYWRVPGTVGNTKTLDDSDSGGHVVASDTTLLGGTATQSFYGDDSTDTKKLLVVWYDKNP